MLRLASFDSQSSRSLSSLSPSSLPSDWSEWMPECLLSAISIASDMSSSSYSYQHHDDGEDDDDEEPLTADDEDLETSTTAVDEDEEEFEDEAQGQWTDHGSGEEEEGEAQGNGGAPEEDDMDIFSDEDAISLSHVRRPRYQFQTPTHARTLHLNQPNQSSRSLACLSCKETYTSRRAGTCRECYDEASETKEALKKEIEELHARMAFLKTWAPEAMEENYADILLECVDGSKIRAHRVVLISRSTVFKAMLESKMEESRTNTIKISDFTYDVLRLFVHYLYTAEIYSESLEDCAGDLLALAEKYNVKQLKIVCERHMISKLNSGNAISNFEYASLHSAKNLKQAALSTILENIQDLVGKAEYQELVNRDAKLVVEIYEAYLAKQMTQVSTK